MTTGAGRRTRIVEDAVVDGEQQIVDRAVDAAGAVVGFPAAGGHVQPLLPQLRRSAPGTRLAVLPAEPLRMGRQAEHAEIDLGFVTRDAAPPRLRWRPLFTERYVLVGRARHPALRRRPSLGPRSASR